MASHFDTFKEKAVRGMTTVLELSDVRSIASERLSETILNLHHTLFYSIYVKVMFLETEGKLYEKENDYLDLAEIARTWNDIGNMDIKNIIRILVMKRHSGDQVKAKRHLDICHDIVNNNFDAMMKEIRFTGKTFV